MSDNHGTETRTSLIWKPVQTVITSIITIGAVVVAIYGLAAWIDSRVETLISDDNFIQKLSLNLRPFVIFDSNNSIVYDQGAMNYIDHIQVDTTSDQNLGLVVQRIVISPNRFLATPPLLDCIDIAEHVYRPTRGKKFDWVYDLAYAGSSGPSLIRFRLEILR